MFAKDFDTLNEIYNQKILSEMNLGPQGDQDLGAGLSIDNIKKIEPSPQRPCLKCGDNENCEMPVNHEDTNGSMAKQSLYRLVKLSAMLHDLICKEQNVEPWVLTKVTEALNHVESVYGYMDYENYKHQVDSDISALEEETESDLYDTILTGSEEIITNIKHVLSNESRENLEKFLYETINALEAKQN
jgi:hypothetical protein